jgi:DNA-directed RNA polymerase sigma subunit (sigma70/sigma32)
MTDTEFAKKLYCYILNVPCDDGDADTQGILEVIKTLKDFEQIVLRKYFECGSSYKKAGDELGVNPERVRYAMLKAKLKLRHHSRMIKVSVKRGMKENK